MYDMVCYGVQCAVLMEHTVCKQLVLFDVDTVNDNHGGRWLQWLPVRALPDTGTLLRAPYGMSGTLLRAPYGMFGTLLCAPYGIPSTLLRSVRYLGTRCLRKVRHHATRCRENSAGGLTQRAAGQCGSS